MKKKRKTKEKSLVWKRSSEMVNIIFNLEQTLQASTATKMTLEYTFK